MFAIAVRLVDKFSMRAGLLVLAVLLGGCGPAGRGIADDDLSIKAPAIKSAVAEKQRVAVPQLVTDLDDDDSAVRFYAIEGLRRLTGQTFEYYYYDDAPARAAAVLRWQGWLKMQPAGESRIVGPTP